MPKSNNEVQGDLALQIAEERRRRLERKGHDMSGPTPPWRVSPNMRGSGHGTMPRSPSPDTSGAMGSSRGTQKRKNRPLRGS